MLIIIGAGKNNLIYYVKSFGWDTFLDGKTFPAKVIQDIYLPEGVVFLIKHCLFDTK